MMMPRRFSSSKVTIKVRLWRFILTRERENSCRSPVHAVDLFEIILVANIFRPLETPKCQEIVLQDGEAFTAHKENMLDPLDTFLHDDAFRELLLQLSTSHPVADRLAAYARSPHALVGAIERVQIRTVREDLVEIFPGNLFRLIRLVQTNCQEAA